MSVILQHVGHCRLPQCVFVAVMIIYLSDKYILLQELQIKYFLL